MEIGLIDSHQKWYNLLNHARISIFTMRLSKFIEPHIRIYASELLQTYNLRLGQRYGGSMVQSINFQTHRDALKRGHFKLSLAQKDVSLVQHTW